MSSFFERRNYFGEIRERLSRAMEASEGVSPSLRATGLQKLGFYVLILPDVVIAQRLLEESLEIRQALGDRLGIAQSLNMLGSLARHQDYDLARQHYEASLLIHRELGNRRGISAALNNLGTIASDQGDPATARRYYEESLEMKRAEADPYGIYLGLFNLGRAHFDAKEYHDAGVALRECLAVAVEHTMISSFPWALGALASLIAVTDTPLNAARIRGHLERMTEESGGNFPRPVKETMDAEVPAARAALNDDAAFDAAWQEGRAMSVEQAVALALEKSDG